MGSTPLLPLTLGDDSGELLDKFHKWSEKVIKRLKLTFNGQELKPFLDKKYYENSFNPKEKKTISDIVSTEKNENIIAEKVDAETTPELEVFNEKTQNKPRKMKFQKNVSNGTKISKANSFQIQQKIVKNESKTPINTVVSNMVTNTKKEGGCCGGGESKDKNKVEKGGSAEGSCCNSSQVGRAEINYN